MPTFVRCIALTSCVICAGCGAVSSSYAAYQELQRKCDALQEAYDLLEEKYILATAELAEAKSEVRSEREAIRDLYIVD